ncbi:hypothetical protein [uncultured Clostridium sp.]
MSARRKEIDGKWYYFNSDGYMVILLSMDINWKR